MGEQEWVAAGRTIARIAVLVGASGVLACGRAAPPARPRDGTARMADTLAILTALNRTKPLENPFLNTERVALIKSAVARQSGREAFQGRHLLAMEQLQGGQTREAIAGLKSLIRDAGESPDRMTPQAKTLFEGLALAYLRLGEQENCIDNPGANVCILPLKGAGRHTHEEGAREAIKGFTQVLRAFPDDRSAQWLLNIAYMAIGGYPDSIPAQYLIPNLSPSAKESFPLFPNIAGEVGAVITGLAGGLDIEDFNGDGLLDIFTTAWGINDPIHLYFADGKGRYIDVSGNAGLEGIVGGLNSTHADYDNDGDADILVLRGGWLGKAGNFPKSLLRNRGDGTFEDVTFAAGLLSLHPTQTAAWADFNLDGYLDLFIGHESNPEAGFDNQSELYVSNRDGTFTEVSRKVGIDLNAFVKGVTWGDVNNDGLPDLYASVLNGKNRLYLNKGGTSIDTWRFEECAEAAGVALPLSSFVTWFFDYDQDGWDDILALSYDGSLPLSDAVAREYLGMPIKATIEGRTIEVESSHLYRNKHDGTFEDVTDKAGLGHRAIFAMGSNYGDLDNDGWLDFYLGTGNPDLRSVIPNRMFHSVEGRRFEEVTLPGGFGHIQKGHGAAFVDLDRDGDEDVYMVLGGAFEGDRFASVLFENPGWPGRNWVTLELQGRSANRSAIGARVELDLADGSRTRTVRRTVGTGGSFGAGSLQLHVGLGKAARIKEVRIRWPDSTRTQTSYRDVAVNKFYHITQGEAPVLLDRPPLPFHKVPLGMPPGEHQHP